MKAWILIVGDDPVLLHSRAQLLRDWHITTASSRNAAEALRAREYDLLIFSQTVHERFARALIAIAQEVHPNSSILAIRSGDDRRLGSATYQVDLGNPGGLRAAVAEILERRPGHPSST